MDTVHLLSSRPVAGRLYRLRETGTDSLPVTWPASSSTSAARGLGREDSGMGAFASLHVPCRGRRLPTPMWEGTLGCLAL